MLSGRECVMECNCLNQPGLSCTCTFGPFRAASADGATVTDDIVVTPKMIRAGGDALCSFDVEWGSTDLKVEAVYRAMRALEPERPCEMCLLRAGKFEKARKIGVYRGAHGELDVG